MDEAEDEDEEAIVVVEAAIVEFWVVAAVACSDTMKKSFDSKINEAIQSSLKLWNCGIEERESDRKWEKRKRKRERDEERISVFINCKNPKLH